MKKKLLLTSFLLSAALSINIAHAAEDIVYYDATDLDTVFDKHPDFDRQKHRSKDFVPKDRVEEVKTTEKISEPKEEGTRVDVYHYNKIGRAHV